LNQEGVQEIHKHHYEKAEPRSIKLTCWIPDDPFTLNNLGYIAELQGQVDERNASINWLESRLRTP